MSEFQETTTQAAAPRWVGLAIAALGATSLLGIGIGWSALNQGKTTEQNVQASVKQQNEALMQRLGKTDDENQLRGDVTGVKNDLDEAKGKLDRATGDMGVMSGLIARNHDDLESLKQRGDRNYFEFTIQRAKTPQHVGPVAIALNKTDSKKSKYTITVLADDKSIEKKDRTAGEPVQFYVKGTGRTSPYEIVVFDVNKNTITGYLSTPKGAGGATAATNTSGQ